MAYRQGQKSYRTVYPTQTMTERSARKSPGGMTDAGVQYSASFPGRYVAIFDHLAGHLHERALQLNQSTTSGDLPDWAAPLTAFIVIGSTSQVTLDSRFALAPLSPHGLYVGLSVRFSVAIGSSVG